MDSEAIKWVQKEVGVTADGIAGSGTLAAIDKAVGDKLKGLEGQRKVIGYIQLRCNEKLTNMKLDVDGYWGQLTDYQFSLLQKGAEEKFRDEVVTANVGGSKWPIQNTAELMRFYGNVGEHQTSVVVPYPLKIAWNGNIITKFSCHEKVADDIVWVLERVKDHYGDNISTLGLDLWGGCLNVRQMRGGSSYSTHSWGIAIDWDPERNQLRWGRDKANFAKPEYETWWKLWEERGAVSLGRAKNYDWMHVQFARV